MIYEIELIEVQVKYVLRGHKNVFHAVEKVDIKIAFGYAAILCYVKYYID